MIQSILEIERLVRGEQHRLAVRIDNRWSTLTILLLIACAVTILLAVVSVAFFASMRARRRMHRDLMVESHLRKQAADRFSLLARNASDIFWITSPDESRVLYLSPAFERLTGIPCERVYRRPLAWLDAVSRDDRRGVIARTALHRGRIDRATRSNELRGRDVNGEERWMWLRSEPILSEAGEVEARYGIAIDITDRKRAEAAVRAERERLEAALEGSNVCYWDWDLRSGKIYRSSIPALLGYAPNEIGPPRIRGGR